MPIAKTHCIERTSPKGGPFLGTCRLCGQPGLIMADALKWCPNPVNKTDNQALLDAISGNTDDEKVELDEQEPTDAKSQV